MLFVTLVAQRHAVGTLHLARQAAGLLETNVRMRDLRCREAGYLCLQLVTVIGRGFYNAEVECAGKTGRDAGRFQADLQPVNAHIALGDMSGRGVQLRCIVGAHPGTVTAAKTDIRILQHGAILGELGVGQRRATLQADRVVAMIAGHGDIHALVGRV